MGLSFQTHEGGRERVDDVAGHHAVLTETLGGDVTRKAVDVNAHSAGLLVAVSLAEKREDNSCEDVAAASCGHARVACGVEIAGALRRADRAVRALDDDIDLLVDGQFTCALKFFVVVSCVADQSE